MIKVLWLAPNINHYKARFLSLLAKEPEVELTVLSGAGRSGMGDVELAQEAAFKHINIPVAKQKFGYSRLAREELRKQYAEFDWVMLPAEKKNLILFFYALFLRLRNPKTKLFSYNHPISKSKNKTTGLIDYLVTKFFYRFLDRIIFYTEASHNYAVKNGLVEPSKANWANNTIDTTEVKRYYSFDMPPTGAPTIIFIGRLIASKRVSDLFQYFFALQKHIPNLRLEIIGDGPEAQVIAQLSKNNPSIVWHGAVISEELIAPIMKRSSCVFIPGHSGLSINHAFAYGRPYITLNSAEHAPEIAYLEDGTNGLILAMPFDANINNFKELLLDLKKLENFCRNAFEKGDYLSVQNWIAQMKAALLHE